MAPFTDSFTYCVNDGNQSSAPVTVTLTIVPNTAPSANLYQYPSGDEDTSQTIRLFASDAENDPLSYEIVAPPQNGTLSGTAPNLVYTPNPHFMGADSFTFRASDGELNSNIATVSIQVSGAVPVAHAKSASVLEDTVVTIGLSGTAYNGAKIAAWEVVSQPQNGGVEGGANARNYRPAANYFGTDSSTYRVRDNRGVWSAPATVSVTVTPVNDAPSFDLSTTNVRVARNAGAITMRNFATNLSKGPANENGQTLSWKLTNYTKGFFAVNPTVDANGTLRFMVKNGKTGSANLQITLSDNGGTNNNGQNQAQPKHFSINVN